MELPEGESFQVEIIDHGKEERDEESHHFLQNHSGRVPANNNVLIVQI
jgi:hypothetical protein